MSTTQYAGNPGGSTDFGTFNAIVVVFLCTTKPIHLGRAGLKRSSFDATKTPSNTST